VELQESGIGVLAGPSIGIYPEQDSTGGAARGICEELLLTFRFPRQARAKHFQQCYEFLPLRNRGLGALAVRRAATSPIFVTATPTCALSQARPLLWLARRAGAQDFARSTRARACLTPRLPRNH